MNQKIKNTVHASLTVEAALVFPIFFFMLLSFLYLFRVIQIHEEIQSGLNQIASELSTDFGVIGNQKENQLMTELMTEQYVKGKFSKYETTINGYNQCIKGGIQGISFIQSSFMKEDYKIKLVANYQITIPIPLLNLKCFSVTQKVTTRAFVGNDPPSDGEEKEDVVFVTKTGKVYHLTRECTHIKLSIQRVSFDQIEELHNASGGKYKKCDKCGNHINMGFAYVTDYGTKYHGDLHCSGLKRTVLSIPMSEVGNRTLCKKCDANRNGE